jgi:hypothetical protein
LLCRLAYRAHTHLAPSGVIVVFVMRFVWPNM